MYHVEVTNITTNIKMNVLMRSICFLVICVELFVLSATNTVENVAVTMHGVYMLNLLSVIRSTQFFPKRQIYHVSLKTILPHY